MSLGGASQTSEGQLLTTLAQVLYEDLVENNKPYPRLVAIQILKLRQYFGFVRGDGVNKQTKPHVEGSYLTALTLLQAIFEQRPFVLGHTPTITDFALMGPMLRHFGQDPTPAEIMRNQAPAVYEWVARMWNAKANDGEPNLLEEPDSILLNLLTEVCETNLAQLRQNAEAFTHNQKRYDQTIQGCHYQQIPSSRYRVWCLEELRRQWSQLSDTTQQNLKGKLSTEASILWDDTSFIPSQYDPERQAPFNHAINVFGQGVPPL